MFKTNDEYTKLFYSVRALLLDKSTKEQLADLVANDCVRKLMQDDFEVEAKPELEDANEKIKRLEVANEKITQQILIESADQAIQLYLQANNLERALRDKASKLKNLDKKLRRKHTSGVV